MRDIFHVFNDPAEFKRQVLDSGDRAKKITPAQIAVREEIRSGQCDRFIAGLFGEM